MDEFWYRVEGRKESSGVDEWDNPLGPPTRSLRLMKLRVLKHTHKGVWISPWVGGKKFVLKDAHKRYACPTEAEAYESFIARKKREQGILSHQLENSKNFMEKAQWALMKLRGNPSKHETFTIPYLRA